MIIEWYYKHVWYRNKTWLMTEALLFHSVIGWKPDWQVMYVLRINLYFRYLCILVGWEVGWRLVYDLEILYKVKNWIAKNKNWFACYCTSSLAKGYKKGDPNRNPWLAKMVIVMILAMYTTALLQLYQLLKFTVPK